MNNIKLKKDSIIYVICPAYTKTGGPELLHQLVKELNDNKIKAYITYYGVNEQNSQYRCAEFDKYTKEYKLLDEIVDNEKNIVIIPELYVAIKQTKRFKHVKKIMWWLSVDNLFKAYRFKTTIQAQGIKNMIKLFLKNELMYSFNYIRNMESHLCQSNYAMEFLKNKKIKNIVYLSDYLNDEYLNIEGDEILPKEDIVLYNPKKGFEFTKKIMEKSPDIKWIPIQNLTTKQVKELLLKSKVYIDFGNHPGKDRFPREAAMCNCCVITGKRGAAKYHEDVPINDEFKFDDELSEIDKIVEKINLCINDYENQAKKYQEYKDFIKGEKERFKVDVKKIFIK